MMKIKKSFVSSLATLATLTSVIAPSAVAFAQGTDAVEQAKDLIKIAKDTKAFVDFNMAYGAVMALPEADQPALLADLAPLYNVCVTDDVQNVLNTMVTLAANKDLSNYYKLYDMIEKTVSLPRNQQYLMGELTGWGKKAVFTPEVTTATDAVIKAWTDKTPENIEAAKNAIAKITNPGSLAWCNVEVVKIEKVVEDSKMALQAASAINEITVQVSGLANTVTEADLAAKKIELSHGEHKLTASYIPSSLTNDGKANFLLDNGAKLVDAHEYMLSSNWAKFTVDSFVAKIAATYVNQVSVTTTGIQEAVSNKVYFTAKNQYSEALDLTGKVADMKVTGTLNGVPLLASEIDTTNLADGYVTINKAVVEKNTVTLTFTNKIADNDVQVGSVAYTVGKVEAAVATTISDMAAKYANAQNGHELNAVAKEVLPDDQITLSVVVKDQFMNPVAAPTVRWVVESGSSLITTEDGKTVSDADATYSFTAKQAGNVKLSAYLANGQKVSYEVTIGAKALSALNLTLENASGYNQDEVVAEKVVQNDGAVLTPAMIKFDVKATKTSVDVAASDVSVVAKLRGGDDEAKKNDIVIVANSMKPGKYTITPYVGNSIDDVNAVKGNAFDVTTTIDSTVASIDNISFNQAELKTGKDIVKDITFRNKHNEVVIVADNSAVVTPNIGTGEVTTSEDGSKNILTLHGTTKGSAQFTISSGSAFKSYALTFADPTFTSINAGADVSGVVAGDAADFAKYQEVKFLDQDGIAMNVVTSDLAVSITKPDGTALADSSKLITLGKTYSVDEDGVVTFAAAGNADNVVAYKVLADAALAQGNYTVKIASLDGKISDTFVVAVGAVREAKTIEVLPASTKVALGGQVKIKVTPKDQYGKFIAVGANNIAVAAGANFSVVQDGGVDVIAIDKDGVKTAVPADMVAYQVTLKGNTKGTNDVSFTIADANAFGSGDLVVKQAMTVDSVANLVNNVAIDATDINSLYSTESADATVNLKAVAKDINGAVVPMSGSDLIWSVISQKDAAGEAVATTVSVDANGVVTAPQNTVGSAVIKVQSSNMKTTTITLNFDKATAAAKTGTTAVVATSDTVVLDADAVKAGIQVALDANNKDGEDKGAVTVKVVAKDQYGNDIALAADMVVLADDTSVVTATPNQVADTVTIKAKSVGTSNVYIQFNGDTIKLEVSVNQAAVDAAK